MRKYILVVRFNKKREREDTKGTYSKFGRIFTKRTGKDGRENEINKRTKKDSLLKKLSNLIQSKININYSNINKLMNSNQLKKVWEPFRAKLLWVPTSCMMYLLSWVILKFIGLFIGWWIERYIGDVYPIYFSTCFSDFFFSAFSSICLIKASFRSLLFFI